MAQPAQQLVVTDEHGNTATHYLFKSSLLKFELKYKRKFEADSTIDQSTVSFYSIVGRWPENNDELITWVDEVSIEAQDVPETNGKSANPTLPTPAEPTS